MIRIVVYGLPIPQGSKKFVGMRGDRPLMVEDNKRHRPWREQVTKQAAVAMAKQAKATTLEGPLVVLMTFTLPKPKSAPKTRRTWPQKKPDASKLARAVEDSLTDAGVWADDALVVDLIARKRYPLEGADSLEQPGVVIRIYEAGAFEADVFAFDDDQPAQLFAA